ncbi:hypothetical protein [Cellulomonas sp. SG140]|uniref:hypothetical protein n=1 Tax=Cellulomonas sp. SG140 TaxID=2976536 RepID=UPI0021E6EE28|nr:hypothetical protein [Cellulomonas sp. SG140]
MSIQTSFERFDRENPKVYERLVELAIEWLATRPRVGVKMLWEVLRWETSLRTAGDEFKLNNNFQSRYARKLLADFPEWEGRVMTRELRAA